MAWALIGRQAFEEGMPNRPLEEIRDLSCEYKLRARLASSVDKILTRETQGASNDGVIGPGCDISGSTLLREATSAPLIEPA